MNDDIYSRLSARFETHKKVNKGGGDQTYVPAFDVIDRLNTELGVFGWSFRVVREGFTATEAWVLGELTATRDGVTVTRQQYGNEPITMGRSEKATADLLKKAATDALKKAATLIGVAAYLYDEDERREVEQEMREQARGGNKPAPKPERPAANDAAPSPLKTKAQLVEQMNRGLAMARSLGLEPADQDAQNMDRVAIQEVIAELARQIKIVKAAKAEAAS